MKTLVLIPSYNSGPLLRPTVEGALAQWKDVWVVIDGSTDGSDVSLGDLGTLHPGLRVIKQSPNQGKGAAVFFGVREAAEAGFTHVLTMDADGQHPADRIPQFVNVARLYPEAAIMGRPEFGPEAPLLRVRGRKLSNVWANIETLGWGIGDSLFGMRLYPIGALIKAFESTSWARRFDFDTEVAVRIAWQAVPIINLPTPVKYLSLEEGGISQFRYLRDNTLLTWMHLRLFISFWFRLPVLLIRRLKGGNPHRHFTLPNESPGLA